MSLTSQEPSTKFYGPQLAFGIPKPASRCFIQLFNLEQGDDWEPAFAADLLAPHILLPQVFNPQWRIDSAGFRWRFHHRFSIMGLTVGRLGTGQLVFDFRMQFVAHEWFKNSFTSPTGNYAFNGTATVSITGQV